MFIMSADVKVVWFDENFDYEILNMELAPLYVKNRGNVKKWIEERAVDPNRPNSRAVKSRQGLSKNAGAYETAMKVDAAAITDNFWVKGEKDSRTYEDILFRKNDFFGLALYRDFSGLSLQAARTPELTNIGAQEKGWKLEHGVWWLYKNEPAHEIFSEYLTYRIGDAMGYDMAEYRIADNGRFIKTKDFTRGNYNLQHIDGIMIDHDEHGRQVPDDDFAYNYVTLKELEPSLAEAYLKICVLDALCENYDRHTKNYGVLTDPRTGKILSLAPNYDNNNSLFANYKLSKERTGGLLAEFLHFVKTEKIEISVPTLSESAIQDIIEEASNQINYSFNRNDLKEFFLNGYEKLKG